MRIDYDGLVLSDIYHQLLSSGSSGNYYHELSPLFPITKGEKRQKEKKTKGAFPCVSEFLKNECKS